MSFPFFLVNFILFLYFSKKATRPPECEIDHEAAAVAALPLLLFRV